MKLLCALTLIVSLISCAPRQASPEIQDTTHLGAITFDVTGNAEARQLFIEGMLLLHSFEYKDAAAQFRAAQQADPECVMAYWGEALTQNHPLWQAQYTDEGREALAKLGPSRDERLAKAQTVIERQFLEGAEILFGEGEKFDRDVAYSEHMAAMSKQYPDNHEVSALYGLSLLGSSNDGRDQALYDKCAEIAKGILAENPEHPGALHYLIHSYDDPGHAHLALEAANNYSQVAPDAAHALHMPSHIYIAMGMWDEVISSNIASWDAANARMARKGLDNDARNYHALHWLMYAYLQKGEDDKARSLLDSMLLYGREKQSDRGRAYMISMRATYLVDAAEWDEELASMALDADSLNVTFPATNDFVAGMHAYRNEDISALEEIIVSMQERRSEEHKRMMQRGAAMCSGVSWAAQLPNQVDINNVHIMEMELQAMRSMLANDPQQAEIWLNQAVALEEETSFMFGPPVVVKPSAELYGEWLASRDLAEAAMVQFNKALERAPGRRLLVAGKRSVSI